MSDTELTVVNNTTAIQTGGLGVDFNNPLFRLKPATLNITKEGRYKVSDTGDEFEEMFVTLLDMPQESRSYYIGDRDDMNRTPENLMCFSTDMVIPNEKAKMPQAPRCAGCPRQDWQPYRDAKARGVQGKALKALIPPCEPFYKALFMDTVYQMPLRAYFRSTRRQPFEEGMQKVARQIAMLKAQGRNPNIFDVRFRLSLKAEVSGKFTYYVPIFSDVKAVTDEERLKFGQVYLQYISYKQAMANSREEEAALADVEATNTSIDAALTNQLNQTDQSSVLTPEYVADANGEIQI